MRLSYVQSITRFQQFILSQLCDTSHFLVTVSWGDCSRVGVYFARTSIRNVMQIKKVCLTLIIFAGLTGSIFSVASADGDVGSKPEVEANFLGPSANSTTTTVRRNIPVASTTTVVPGIPFDFPATFDYIPDEPAPGNYLCGTSQYLKLILAKDGLNYQCQKSGSKLFWKWYDCKFGKSVPPCLTLPPNAIQPEIQDRFWLGEEVSPESIMYGQTNVGIYIKTSTMEKSRYVLEISIDADFKQVVFMQDSEVFFDATWRCDVVWCALGFVLNEIPSPSPNRKFYGISKVTGNFYARATVTNSTGIARRNFGLKTLPGPQMILAEGTVSATTVPVSNATTTTTTIIATITPVVSRTSITCAKGKLIKVVKAFNAKCPSGYKQK